MYTYHIMSNQETAIFFGDNLIGIYKDVTEEFAKTLVKLLNRNAK